MAIAQGISSAAFSKRLPASSHGVWQLLESDFRGRNDRVGVVDSTDRRNTFNLRG